jgi:hypothetical protein
MGPRIDLSEFRALKVLRIIHLFLVGVEESDQAWKGLPPDLEVLEVFYDDTGYETGRLFDGHPAEDDSPFSDEEDAYQEDEEEMGERLAQAEEDLEEWWRGQWLCALLVQQAAGRFPKLKTVRLYTPESEPGTWLKQDRETKIRLWTLPEFIQDLAREAAVKVEVWLCA